MAMETTLGACLDAEASLLQLATIAWPVKTAYHIAKLIRLVRDRTKAFEAQRVTVVKDLGAPRPPNEVEKARGLTEDVIEVAPDKMQAYFTQYTELRAQATTIEWAPLTLAELEGPQIMPATLLDLGPFLAE